MATAVRHTVKLRAHKRALEGAGGQGLPFTHRRLVVVTAGAMGVEHMWSEMAARARAHVVRDSSKGQSTCGQQMAARARAHVVSKQIRIVLATNLLNGTCQDASGIHSSVDRDLSEGLRANTVSHCHAPLRLIFSRFIAPA